MDKRIGFSTVILLILCFGIVAQVAAQNGEILVGVSEGNTFRYDAKYFWRSSNPLDTVPAAWANNNKTEYLQVTISMVTLNTVTITEVQHFLDGSETERTEVTVVGTDMSFSVLLYAANLNAGDYLIPKSVAPYTVNSTVSRAYVGGARATNYVENRMTDVEGYVYRYLSLYFDRQTGMLVEAYFEDVTSDKPDQTFSYTYKLIDTNAWSAGPSIGGVDLTVILVAVAVVVIVVAVGVFLFYRRKRKRKKR